MEDILTLLSNSGAFSKRQKKVAEYISANYDTAAFMTAEHLAKAANVSESTVVRFSAELGFDSFSGLRRSLQNVLREKIEWHDTETEQGTASALNRAIAKSEQSAKLLSSAANAAAFERLCEYVRYAANICVCGQGRSYALAQYAAWALCELRAGVTVLHTSDAEAAAGRLRPEDLLLDISLHDGGTAHISAGTDAGVHIALIRPGENTVPLRADDLSLRADDASAVILIIDALCSELSGQ